MLKIKIILVILFIFFNNRISAMCVPDEETLCLDNNRFQVMVNWRDEENNNFTIDNLNHFGYGQKTNLLDDTGSFWFFSDQNHELLVRVLDGCAINNNYWVFSAATTNVEYTLTVTDTTTNSVKQYFNPLNTPSPPITDTSAFSTCANNRINNHELDYNPKIDIEKAVVNNINNNYFPPFSGQLACNADMTTMCLYNNRFAVNVEWEDFNQKTGSAFKINITDQSGYFSFFNLENPSLLVNIYDAQLINDSYWVYLSGLTNIAYTVYVTDTVSGITREYSNPIGGLTVILDNQGNGDIIFKNGFE